MNTDGRQGMAEDLLIAQWDYCTTEELTAVLARLLATGKLSQRDILALAARGVPTCDHVVLRSSEASNSTEHDTYINTLGDIVGDEVVRRFWIDRQEAAA